MYEGWASFAGTEIVNTARAATYSRINVTNRCTALAASLGDGPYTNPADDQAPWFDETLPESARFWGVVGLDFTGGANSTATRDWTELLSDGGVPGQLRRASREFPVKVALVAADEQALSYGLAWLASALRGSNCDTACTGDELCVYAACPAQPLLPAGDLCGTPDPTWTPAAGGDAVTRTLFNAALLTGPTLSALARVSGGLVAEAGFTVKAGVPYFYRNPVTVLTGTLVQTNPQPGVYQDLLPNYDPWSWQFACAPAASCTDQDPYCADVLPILPPIPPDPCFPNNPTSNPSGYRFTAARSVFPIPKASGVDWLEKVPVLTFWTGSAAMRRLIVRWYPNPTAMPCAGGQLDPCSACAEINLPWLPASTVLTIDGRTSQAGMQCGGGTPGSTTSQPRLYGPLGGPYAWPVFDCSAGMCVEILCDAASLARDSTLAFAIASREDMA